jgi:hypothetical protein
MSGALLQHRGIGQASLAKPRSERRATVKHRGMIEKKLERFYRESEELGWDYDNFVSSVLEILTVLHHRNKKRCEL